VRDLREKKKKGKGLLNQKASFGLVSLSLTNSESEKKKRPTKLKYSAACLFLLVPLHCTIAILQ